MQKISTVKTKGKKILKGQLTIGLDLGDRRVSTTLRQVLTKFSEFFVFGAPSGFFPENFVPGSCRSGDRQLA